ncbi:MAG TPA: LytR C-terminal domain-containing protein [Galbitalea sp.]|nr:LytR C-terminal domain-containing protein [Galbitalea sp.]
MANFRTDQFDNLPENIDRIGAHRGPKVRGRGWITFAWAILATAVLVVGGLYVLSIFNTSIKFGLGPAASAAPTTSSTPVPVITPIEDPSSIASRNITVTVLNGTDIVGLDKKAAAKLTAKGWNVIATAPSTATNLKTSTVYYSAAADEDVAEGIQSQLGAQDIQFSSAFPGSSITVVVGSDFTG